MKKWKVVLPVICAAVLTAGISFVGTVKAEENDQVILDNIFIGDIAVGGMSKEQALEEIDQHVTSGDEAVITLEVDGKLVEASPEDLGIAWDNQEIVDEAYNYGRTGNLLDRYKAKKDLEKESKVFDVVYTVDGVKTTAFLENHVAELNQEVVDGSLTRENGVFNVVPGQNGVEVDTQASVQLIQDFVAGEWDGGDVSISLVANVVEPRGTEEELRKVQDRMGSFSTDFSSSAWGRKKNIEVAVGKINGTVLYPGDEFSVYDTIAPLNAANGYELAGSYENGTVVESYGGGVCQVSTTLYNAVIRSELEVTERFAHSMIVTYVQPSMDAAVAGGLKDFKFKNNTDSPIYIEGYCDKNNAYFNVYGNDTREAGREVSFVSETISREEPTTTIVASDNPIGFLATDAAHVGSKARLWKVVKVNGVEQSREVFNTSSYRASPKTLHVGNISSNSEAVNAINAAIASQDEAAVREAASYWCDEAIAARAQQTPPPAAEPDPSPQPSEPTGTPEPPVPDPGMLNPDPSAATQ
ncbi:MAG: VanW family protein [Lachnospiraceae bacterium]|nr:VanW family protein [Lachnospiraceae bacterium]